MDANNVDIVKQVADSIFNDLFDKRWPNGVLAESDVNSINNNEGWPVALPTTPYSQGEQPPRIRLTPEQVRQAYTMAQGRYLNYFEPDQIGFAFGQPEMPAEHPKPPFEISVWIERVPSDKENAIKQAVMKEWPAARSWEQKDRFLLGSGRDVLPYENADPDALLNRLFYAIWRVSGRYITVHLQTVMHMPQFTFPQWRTGGRMTYEAMRGNNVLPWEVDHLDDDGGEDE